MKFDLTITLSIIIIFVTSISPIIVTVLNNRHQYKLKKLESYELEKRNALKKFIDVAIDCFNQDNWQNNKEFVKTLYTLKLFFKSVDDNFIQKINETMNFNKDKDKFKISFITVLATLSKEIKKH